MGKSPRVVMDGPWLNSLKQVDSFRNNRTIELSIIVSNFSLLIKGINTCH
jgi:hypothetical protein